MLSTYYADRTEKTAYVIDTRNYNPSFVAVNRTGSIIGSLYAGDATFSFVVTYYSLFVVFAADYTNGIAYYPYSLGNSYAFGFSQYTGHFSTGMLLVARGGISYFQYVFCQNNQGIIAYKTYYGTLSTTYNVQLVNYYVSDAIIAYNGVSLFIAEWN